MHRGNDFALPSATPAGGALAGEPVTTDTHSNENCMRRSTKKGFTLIELLIVVVIIGILAAVAIPKFSNTKQRAARASGIADMRNLATAQEGFRADSNRYAGMADTGTAAGKLNFTPSNGNTALFLSAGAVGWWGSVAISGGQSCGMYLNTARPGVIPASAPEGVAVCW